MSKFIVDLGSPFVLAVLFGGCLFGIVMSVIGGLDNFKLDAEEKIAKLLGLHPLAKELYDEAEIRKSIDYNSKFSFFKLMAAGIDDALEKVVFFLGVPAMLVYAALLLGALPFPVQLSAVMACVIVFKSITSTPLQLLSDKIDKMYGYSCLTMKTFISDKAKSILVHTLMFALEVTAAFYILQWLGKLSFMTVIAFLLSWQLLSYAISIVNVYVIEPMFNKYKPLEASELKEKLKSLVEKYGYKLDNVFVMDESRRSKKGNAYCMSIPFGPKRIVIYDTLIEQLSTDEIVAVFAHELGHEKLKHNQLFWVIEFLHMAVFAYVAVLFVYDTSLYHAFGMRFVDSSNIMAFTVIGLWLTSTLVSSVSWLLTPLESMLSRKCEYAADRYAIVKGGAGEAMVTALLKLEQKNGGDIAAGKAWTWWHASHPGIVERIEALQSTLRK